MTWDDVQAERDKADEWATIVRDSLGGSPNIAIAVLAIQAEVRALERTLEMLLTAFPDSAATLGDGG